MTCSLDQRDAERKRSEDSDRPDAVLAVYSRLLAGHLGHAVTLAPEEAVVVVRALEELLALRVDGAWLAALEALHERRQGVPAAERRAQMPVRMVA